MSNPIGFPGFRQQRAIEILAEEFQVSIAEVTGLYEDQWAVFEDGARISSFLGILTTRRVRELLRQRSAGKPPQPRRQSTYWADQSVEIAA